MPPPRNCIIDIKNATITQQGIDILKNINLKIEKGAFVYIIGKVGSGKSSFLKTLYADLSLKQGYIKINGFNLKNIKKSEIPLLRRKCDIIFQTVPDIDSNAGLMQALFALEDRYGITIEENAAGTNFRLNTQPQHDTPPYSAGVLN